MCQNPFEHHQMSDNTAGSSLGYNEVSSPGTHVTTAGTNSADYPFTMQLSYPASDYSSLDQDYTVVGRGDDPMFNSWTADEFESSMTPTSPSHPSSQQQQQPGPPVPDAVINMAAKVGSDKKPFAYVADVNDIRQQRERVRRKYASLLLLNQALSVLSLSLTVTVMMTVTVTLQRERVRRKYASLLLRRRRFVLLLHTTRLRAGCGVER